jgi:acetyltransferase
VERGPAEAREILAVARIMKQPGTKEAEFAVLVADRWQRQGLGRELLRHLIEIARQEKHEAVFGHILIENIGMTETCRRLGFTIAAEDPETLQARLQL